MIEVVGAPDVVVVVDEDSVRAGKHALAPGVEKPALLVKDDDRVRPAVEDVDAVSRIDGDSRHLDERPVLGQLFPAFEHLVLQLVRT